jgi:hypothetical protein
MMALYRGRAGSPVCGGGSRLDRSLHATDRRQLDETRQFAESVPEPMRQYLSRENVLILTEELEFVGRRLTHWREIAGTLETPGLTARPDGQPPHRPRCTCATRR